MWGDIPKEVLETVERILQAVKDKDIHTYQHCVRVGQYSRSLAAMSGLNEFEQYLAEYAGLLHDVGKILIPSNIIHKAGPLDDSEFKTMKMHPIWSASALTPHIENDFFQKIMPGVLHHHERIDGHGYPDKLEGDQIPLLARIVALVDAMDAITQNRSYRKHCSFEYVVSEVKRCSGKQFDSQLAKIFLETAHHWKSSSEENRKTVGVIAYTRAA